MIFRSTGKMNGGVIYPAIMRGGGFMNITLYITNSEHNQLSKILRNPLTLTGTLKDETDIINPVVMIEIENPVSFNYAYIPEFDRYYFISDISVVRNNLWRVSMSVDVLQSFRNEIRNVSIVLSNTYDFAKEMYLSSDVWKSKVKELTSIVNFPNGLDENGHFILITAGG